MDKNPNEQTPKKKPYNSYKRSSVSKFSSMITLFIMVPVFALIGIFMLVFPKSQESMIEKRKLASFPELTFQNYFSGDFTRGINTWYTDTVPFRDNFKNAGNGFKGMFGITTNDSVNVVNNLKKVDKKPKNEDSKPTVVEIEEDCEFNAIWEAEKKNPHMKVAKCEKAE